MINSVGRWTLFAWLCSACTGSPEAQPADDEGGATQTGGVPSGLGGVTTTHTSSQDPSKGGTQTNYGGSPSTTTQTGGSSKGGTTQTGGSSKGGTTQTGGSSKGGTTQTGGTSTMVTVRLPVANAAFDYQIGGAYTPPAGVQIVSRDRNSSPANGLYNICYVNGFQSQPDEEAFWTASHPELLLKDASGAPVVDADWGEYLLDTSTVAKRTALASIVGQWIEQCATDGFDAIEVDNLDSYSRSGGLLTQAQNVAMMRLLSDRAHAKGLAVAQKNSTELLGNVTAMGTDFAVAEECNRWGECGDYQGAYGNRVYIIEYRAADFTKGCSDYPGLSIVLRDLNVSTPSSSSYVFNGC